MRGLFKVLFALVVITAFFPLGKVWAQGKRDADAAYDPINNRYLMVWEQDDGSGNTDIVAQFRNPDGTAAAESPATISVPRPTQGCFYGDFDSQNSAITTPTNCPQNKNPSVAYNDGQYLIVWEVHGTANAPRSAPDNQFVNIFARVIDANNLNPLPGWEEGILISKIFIAANNADSRCGDRHACNDGQIQAWSQSINPDVAPRVGGQGFVVTWQTNKDFIGCADPDRRRAWAVYGRYIDQNFSATSTSNPAAFAVFKDDSTAMATCEPRTSVDNGINPRIAFNQTSNDFVIVYEVARASGGNASIGAKQVILDSNNLGQTSGSLMPDIVATVSGASLNNPEVVSFKDHYVLFASDGTDIRATSFTSAAISVGEPAALALSSGAKINPHAATNLGIGGQRSGANSSPERILVAYENGDDIFAATVDENLNVRQTPENISAGVATANRAVEVASDAHNFLGVWSGQSSGGEKVFAELIDTADNNLLTPTLLTPNDMATFAPVRAYLSWNAPTGTAGGTITYRIYFGENVIPATPQITGVTATHFVIGPETQGTTGVTLQANKIYKWKVEADDGQGGITSSPVRTLNTDNSVVGWWRFDENPVGPICAGGAAGETDCDSSGNNNHGIPNGSPAWLPPPSSGILGGAINFDGINDFISVQDTASLNPNSLTVIARIKTNSKVGEQELVDQRGNSFASYNLRIQGSSFPLKIVWVIRDSSTTDSILSSGNIITDLTIYQIVATYDQPTGEAKLYLNGGLVGSQNFGVLNRNTKSTSSLIFGDASVGEPTSLDYKGIIDEIIIMNRANNNEEIANNYSATNY